MYACTYVFARAFQTFIIFARPATAFSWHGPFKLSSYLHGRLRLPYGTDLSDFHHICTAGYGFLMTRTFQTFIIFAQPARAVLWRGPFGLGRLSVCFTALTFQTFIIHSWRPMHAMHVLVCAFVCMCTRAYVRTCPHACMRACTHVLKLIYVHICR